MFYVLTYRLFIVTNKCGVTKYLLARRIPNAEENLRVKQRGGLMLMVGVADEQEGADD
jgi:hypothetical protein